MKIKLNKQFLEITGIAAACSVLVTAILAILSLLSWGAVFAALMLLFMPIAQGSIKFYKKKHCYSLENFFSHLIEDEPEDEDENSRIW